MAHSITGARAATGRLPWSSGPTTSWPRDRKLAGSSRPWSRATPGAAPHRGWSVPGITSEPAPAPPPPPPTSLALEVQDPRCPQPAPGC
ncbi:hypothetical protein QJS66_07440 [Kocuria rhizophila]|nr:hypothetical protein QJS66_07440 [Kocuria rhizophila]